MTDMHSTNQPPQHQTQQPGVEGKMHPRPISIYPQYGEIS